MLIAEDLLLLLTDDTSGKTVVDGQRLAYGLAGAVLVELVLSGRVQVTDGGSWGSGARVAVVSPYPLGDQLLDGALARVMGKRRPVAAQTLVDQLSRGLTDAVRWRLVQRGILREEHGRVLGIFPTRAWPAADSTHEAQVRAALWDVVVVGRTPTDREVSLVSLLHAVGQVHKQFGAAGLTARQIRDRARALSAGNVGGEAVRRAIQATETAVLAAVTASSVAIAGS